MALLVLFSVVSALLGVSLGAPAADPSCEPQMGLMPCALPIIMFAMSPEGQEFAALKGEPESITSPQLTSLCRLSRDASQCLHGFVDRCAASSLPNIREILQGTTKLLQVCDSPTLYPDTKILMSCSKKLNTTGSKFQTCAKQIEQKVEGKTKSKQHALQNASAAEIDLEAGKMIRTFCCVHKDFRTCIGSEIPDKCGADAGRLDVSMGAALNEAFSCSAKLSQCDAP